MAKWLISLGAATTMLALPLAFVFDDKMGGFLLLSLMLAGLGAFTGGILLRHCASSE